MGSHSSNKYASAVIYDPKYFVYRSNICIYVCPTPKSQVTLTSAICGAAVVHMSFRQQ